MQLDPTRWLISLAGFIYDWIITREWMRALLCLIPLFLLGGVALAVSSGSRLDRGELARWYMELGEKEISEWEQSWAPATSDAGSPAELSSGDRPMQGESSATETSTPVETPTADQGDAAEDEPTRVSRFAEMLFRRVQMLVPSDRSQFVIAATLAQRGAFEQAKAMLTKIAPQSARGYAPAHALLAQFYLLDLQRQGVKNRETAELLMHHVSEAKHWERVPQSVLRAGSDLFLLTGDQTEALSLLARSADRHPEDNFPLAQRAKAIQNERVYSQAWAKAEEFLTQAIETNPKDFESRIRLAQGYMLAENIDRAEQVLKNAPNIEASPEILRSLSQLYIVKYAKSQKTTDDNRLSVNIQFLDVAMRIDPTNPRVAEEVAKLVKMQGPEPSDEMFANLRARLAEGTATAVTHACLAEMHLAKSDYEPAIPHLEQVINRLPTAAEYLNNLAFILADLHPDRIEEALGYATRAVASSAGQPQADYYDTLGFVLSKLNRGKEAITAFETAIELDRDRVDFHQRAAAEYRKLDDETMAAMHDQVIVRLKAAQAAKATAKATESDEGAITE